MISEALAIAIQRHQAGQLQAAEQIYRQILQADPNQPEALHLLGVMASQSGRHEAAMEYIRRAIGLKGNVPEFHYNLGKVCAALRRIPEAVACYRRAVELNPDLAEAHADLGRAFKELGKLDEAVACYRRALKLRPGFAEVHHNLANACKEQGKLEEAVAGYRRAVELKPDFAEAHLNLGAAFKELGKLDEAVACYRRALKLKPGFAEVHHNLANACKEQGKLDEAVAGYRRAVELKPDFAEAHNNLGNVLTEQGELDDAVASYRCALAIEPDMAEAHDNLGLAFSKQGKPEEAAACFGRAVELKPNFAEAHNNLGNAFMDRRMPAEAAACYGRTLELKPDFAAAHNNLGVAFKEQGQLSEALDCFHRAVELKPDFAAGHNNLGNGFKEQGKLDEAVACFRRALELKPDLAAAHNNLGNAFKDQARLDEAIACYRRAVALDPGYASAHSNLVYTQLFRPECDAPSLDEEHRRWNQLHAAPLERLIRPHLNDRSPDRRLRVGYLSPDFRQHVVGRNLLPLFREHDRQRFEIFCYSDVTCPDEITNRIRGCAQAWRETAGLTDEKLAQRIRDDGVDILIDLTLHMSRNRLLVFARRPAPVQMTFAGYPGTTGLSAIAGRLTDPHLDPPGLHDHFYSEESIRLPDSYWCYDPLDLEPAVNALPAAENGSITFGCLNNFCKVNPLVLTIWAQVLNAVDRSRLMLLTGAGMHRASALDLLEAEGVARHRVTFVAQQPRARYLCYFHDLDIALDTVPYNGHTTSLDSAWMGVPVVTLVGPTVVGRAGLSQLTNLGLPELIASTPDEYVHIAAALAHDLPRLSGLRATLRDRMHSSPLMDAPRFARNIEAAYRKMWRRWCAK